MYREEFSWRSNPCDVRESNACGERARTMVPALTHCVMSHGLVMSWILSESEEDFSS